jgi:hypothetical protein
MLKYQSAPNGASGRLLTGASLAQIIRRMSPPQRACLGADIADGRVVLRGLTIKSIATLVGAEQAYLFAALRCTPQQREEIRAGQRSLPIPRRRTRKSMPAFDWSSVNDDDLVEAVRRIGLDRALAAAVEAERTA